MTPMAKPAPSTRLRADPQSTSGSNAIIVPVAGTHEVILYPMTGHVLPNTEARPAIVVTAKSGAWLGRRDRSRACEAASS